MSSSLHRLLFSALVLSGSLAQAEPYPNTGNFGVPFSTDESWYRQCMQVERRSAPGLLDGKTSASTCNATQLYYDKRGQASTSSKEWRQVLGCALAQEDDAVLMMLYANGFGVAKDTGIAIHHACKLEFIAKAEMEGRIAHLSGPQRPGAVFDQCDDITSGYMGTVCAGIREGQVDRDRKARLERTAQTMPHNARQAFAALRRAADRYAGAAENDMQGSAAVGRAIAREGKLRTQFADTLSEVLDNKLPAASSQDLVRIDKELNTVYRNLMTPAPSEQQEPERVGSSTITRAEVRRAERSWIAYRDAFLAFRAQLASGPSRESIRVVLTRQRLAELKGIMRYR